MANTLVINVVDRSVAPLNHVNIAVINQPNPVEGYTATADEVEKLIQIPNYFITDENGEQVSGLNYYKYFPKPGGGGGGGGSAILIDKTITENGEYSAIDDDADGYSTVVVDVPSIIKSATVLAGSSVPSDAIGNNGDIYVRYIDNADLPTGYTALSYIQTGSTVGAYIDTGLTSSSNISCEISAQLVGTPNHNTWFYGAFSGSKGSPILGFQNNRFEGYIVSGGAIQANDTDIHTFVVDENGISVDGSVKQTGNWSGISVGTPLYLFARGGDISSINNFRIYYCKQWDNGTLVRHFVPAERDSDNAIGMYDIVNDVFYPNQGTVSFIAGQYDDEVIDTFLKVNSSWQSLIGSDVNDVNTGNNTN